MDWDIEESVSEVRKAAVALEPQIREAANEIEQGRRLPPMIADAMKRAGVFGMAMPQAWGGAELDPLEQLRVIETLARFDGSVGWCAMIGVDGGYYSAYLVWRPANNFLKAVESES